jgi:cytochrome P450
LRGLLFTLLFGGYDTTSITMSYTLYMVSELSHYHRITHHTTLRVQAVMFSHLAVRILPICPCAHTQPSTLYQLSQHPAVEAKVLQEVRTVLGGGESKGGFENDKGGLTYENVQKLTYCAAVVQETLRLFPPAPLTVRSLETDLELGGHVLPKDTMIYLPIWWIHRYSMVDS